MDKEKQYTLKAKLNGKFWSFGNLKVNQYGNWQIGMKASEDLQKLIDGANGGWINFSIFEKEDKPAPAQATHAAPVASHAVEDEIPF